MDEIPLPDPKKIDDVKQGVVNAKRELNEAKNAGSAFGHTLTRAFTDVAVRGRKLSDVVRGVALQLSQAALKAAISPIGKALGEGQLGKILNTALGFQKGGVLVNGTPVPFARGGVVASPMTFPLAGGRFGLAGEAGPEAILPLSRGSDGRLGVRSESGAAAVSITFNVTSPDADSFRRSESQIAAMLNRAVSRGDRNL